MTAHLLLVTLGPVQEFIAQSRRTRDLWYGSHVLSELGRAAACALLDNGGVLVFPALSKSDPELVPCPAPLRTSGTPPLNVPNKLLAEVPIGTHPAELARKTREAVLQFWRKKVAAPVKERCASILANDIDAVWEEQVDSFVEFTAAWVPLGDYAEARRQVERAVAARKNLRDFSPWTKQRGNVPKSSLDGARETVLSAPRAPRQRDAMLVQKYRIAGGEQLDAVGLVKRAGGDPDQFVPVVNVALASWLHLASREASGDLEELRKACLELGLSRVARKDLPCAKPFLFDASVLLPSRWKSVFEEQGLQGDPASWGQRYVSPLLGRLSEPYPYVACLVADGDRVGRAIDSLGSADEHRTFSRVLSGFAEQTRRIVEQEHRGALVYAGGDDVLAFLPLPEAIACADALRCRFSELVASACNNLSADARPTLSIGLGVGHVMESMGDLLALGREAEKLAKRDRNALAVVVDKRSGGRRTWSARWNESPIDMLSRAATLLEDRLPSRKVYEVARTLLRLPKPAASGESAWAPLLALEVRRSLSRAGEGDVSPEEAGVLLDESAGYPALHGAALEWVDRMLIARTFARSAPRLRRRDAEAVA